LDIGVTHETLFTRLLEASFNPVEDIKDKDWWKGLSAVEISRNFLWRCIVQQWYPPLPDLLNVLEALQ
jgi:hypothetical protein